jgi:hypothetical protein
MRGWLGETACLLAVLLALILATSGMTQQDPTKPLEIPARGTLKGTVTFVGQLPDLAQLDKTKRNQINLYNDKNVCLMAPKDQVDQRVWMIGAKGGMANVAVYVRPQPGEYFVLKDDDLKPFQQGGPRHEAVMDQPFCAFLPPVLLTFPSYYKKGVLKPSGQLVKIKNSATINRNSMRGPTSKNPGGNPIIAPKGEITLKLVPDRFAIPVRCSLHPWMEAKIMALDHPFAAVTDKDGKYEIKQIPAGVKLQVFAWHESGFVSQSGFKGEPLEVKAGETVEKSFQATRPK